MAGRQPGFDGRAFRRNIRFVMDMGAPTVEGDRATFLFPSQLVYDTGDEGDHDDSGVPFNPAVPVHRVVPDPVQVSCAVEYFDADGVLTDFGMVAPSRAVITVMDEEYELIKDANAVVLGGDKFVYQKTEFPSALFDVGLYTLHFKAENDV